MISLHVDTHTEERTEKVMRHRARAIALVCAALWLRLWSKKSVV